MNQRNRFCSILLLSILPLTSIAQSSSKSKNHPYVNPTPGEITIMASTPIPHGLQPTREAYEDLVECGFNLGTERNSVEGYKKNFAAIGPLNFRFLISNLDLLTDKMANIIEPLKNNPYVAGWNFKDEPNYKDLRSLQPYYNSIYRLDPTKLVYMNLIGGIYGDVTGPAKTYKEYLEIIQKMFMPPVWSFDIYPFSMKNGKLGVSYDSFFNALESMMAMSKSTERPFWSYIQTMAFKRGSTERPAATEAYISFAAFSALAYGAQGILYWKYGQRKSNDSETYLSALVNMDGKKTGAWYAAKKVNSQIKKFNDVFYECTVKEVRHTGSKQYEGTKKLTGSFGPFKSISTGSSGVLVSRIENNINKYIVIVNHDVQNKQNILFKLDTNRSVIDLTDPKGRIPNSGSSFNKTIDKGGFLIFLER